MLVAEEDAGEMEELGDWKVEEIELAVVLETVNAEVETLARMFLKEMSRLESTLKETRSPRDNGIFYCGGTLVQV